MPCGPKVRKNYYASSLVSLSFPQRSLSGVDRTRGNRKGADVKGGLSSTGNTLGSEDRNPPLPASQLPTPVGKAQHPGSRKSRVGQFLGRSPLAIFNLLAQSGHYRDLFPVPLTLLGPCPSTPLAKPRDPGPL